MIHWLWLVPFSLLGFGIGWSAKGLFVEREENRAEEARWQTARRGSADADQEAR